MWRRGDSGYLLITFGDLSVFANGLNFYADTPADKLNLTVFAVMAKGPNWYPLASLAAAKAAVSSRLAQYEEIVINGSSMGGYGAIKHSKLFDATTILAYCPQSTLDPNECVGFSPGWQEYFKPESMIGMGVKQADISGQLYLFSDPRHALDQSHLGNVLAVCPDAQAIPVISGGHDIAPLLAGTDNFQALLDGCRRGNLQQIRETIRKARKDNFYRKRVLIADAIIRRPALMALVISNRTEDEHLTRILSDQLMKMIQAIAKAESWDALVALLQKFSTRLSLRQKLMIALTLSRYCQVGIRMTTNFDTTVCYDAVRDTALHSNFVRLEDEDFFPLNVEFKHGSVRLVLQSSSYVFYLASDSSGRLLAVQNEADFELVPRADGRYFLKNQGRYLSAQPDGKLCCDRSEANDWEAFSINLHIRPR
ncbi:Fascin domain-containing protein [Rhizobium sp. PP-F2F-G36]|nr:Fascin domain-containing protein [Rhizobium sp. PP-F2F-G36]